MQDVVGYAGMPGMPGMLLHSFNSWDKFEMMAKWVQVHVYFILGTLSQIIFSKYS